MARHRILIVEDEHDIAGLIKHTLERSGEAEAQIVGSGDAALKAVTDRAPDLIILDLNLPVIGGLEVCRILRSRADVPHVPIIMLTARTTESDRVIGLDAGADDYITKPFGLRELAARVRAVLRRGRGDIASAPTLYEGAHLIADFEGVNIAVDGRPVRLTRREFELLRHLVENRNAYCRVIVCSNASGATTGWSKRDRSTCTSGDCAASWEWPGSRSRRSSDWAIDSSRDDGEDSRENRGPNVFARDSWVCWLAPPDALSAAAVRAATTLR